MILLENRAVLSLKGKDRFGFLQSLITQDVTPLESGEANILYSAMLNPQGKIHFDFFLYNTDDETLWMDIPAAPLTGILKTLKLYKLRASVQIEEQPELCVIAHLTATPEHPTDPRHPAMGHRAVVPRESLVGASLLPYPTYEAHRITFGIPDSSDFIEGRAFTSEYGLEYLNGVSFTKGCYIGQEIVARTKHRSDGPRKALHQVETEEGSSLPEAGTPITASEKEIGTLRSSQGNQGLAMLRFDRLEAAQQSRTSITVANIVLKSVILPEWFAIETKEAMNNA